MERRRRGGRLRGFLIETIRFKLCELAIDCGALRLDLRVRRHVFYGILERLLEMASSHAIEVSLVFREGADPVFLLSAEFRQLRDD